MSEICARELRATLLGNQPDWKPTHETTYQHTRRRCDGRRMDRRERASFTTRRRAKRDRQVSRADGPSDARNNAEAATTRRPQQRGGRCTRYGARHPLRGAAPVTGRDTRSEGVHCLRIGCSAPNHKNKRGICETITDTHKAPGARAPGASAHSDQPTLHVAPSRPSATVTPARRSRSSSARAQSLAARAAARSDSTTRTSASNAECSAAAAPDAPAPMPACPRGLGNTLTGTARQRARARR